jgi:hypothetical protein
LIGDRGAQPGPIVLLDNLDPVVLGVALHVRPPKSKLNRPHIIFRCHEGVFLLVQFILKY